MAIARFEEAGDGARSNLARALTSLGRLHRAHGHHDQALSAYQRAFTIQQALDDRTGMIQSLTTMAAAYDYLQKGAEARALRERGLALARETESTLLIDTQTAALALDLIDTDDPARGVTMLQDVVARDPFRYYLYSTGSREGISGSGSIRVRSKRRTWLSARPRSTAPSIASSPHSRCVPRLAKSLDSTARR